MTLSKTKIKNALSQKAAAKLTEHYLVTRTAVFEDEAAEGQEKRLKDKVDALTKDIADLEIRKRNTDNEAFKSAANDQIEAKRAQIKTVQKSLKAGREAQASKPDEKDKKDD